MEATRRGHFRSRHGFAITVVILITAIALLSFLFATTTLTLASRNSSAQERSSTQALLAADSGLRTLASRTTEVPFVPANPYADGSLTAWLEAEFSRLDLGDGIVAEIDVVHESVEAIAVNSILGFVTVESTGLVGNSRRVLVQDFQITAGPPIPISVNIPGALTSVGTINSNTNSARILGIDNTVDDWSYADVPLCSASPGEYVQFPASASVGESWYLVADPGCTGTTPIALTNLDGTAGPSVAYNEPVNHRPFAISETLTFAEGGPPFVSTVSVTDATLTMFGEGSRITIGSISDAEDSPDSMGKVTSVGDNELVIAWDLGFEPGPTQPQGTVIRREVDSGVTQGACDLGNNGDTTFPDGCAAGQNLDELFERTFGVTSKTLKDSLTADKLLTGTDLRDGRTISDITWLSNPEQNVRGQTGSGILIIEADPGQTVRLNVGNEFTGLIYVMGNASIAGNAQYQGAIIVDGVANLDPLDTTGADDTSVQGTLDLAYDSLLVARALGTTTRPNNTPGGLGTAIAGTWRMR